MRKPITLFLSFVLISVLISVLYSFAAEERITLTTYYPAPYGVYRELRVDQIAVGSAYRYSPDLTNGTLVVSDRVGIGTSSPSTSGRLDVNGHSIFEGDICIKSYSGGTYCAPTSDGDVDIRFRPASANMNMSNIVASSTGNLVLENWNTGRSVQIRNYGGDNYYNPGAATLFVDGEVGIGTIDPSALLHINGTTQSLFRVDDDGTTDTTPFIIDQDGDVGIGTASPSRRLEVSGSSSAGAQIRLLSGVSTMYTAYEIGRTATEGDLGIAAGTHYSNFATSGDLVLRADTEDLILTARNTSGAIRFGTGSTDSEKVTITSNGKVGIGTTSPLFKLSVSSIGGEGFAAIYATSSQTGGAALYSYAPDPAQYGLYSYGSYAGLYSRGDYFGIYSVSDGSRGIYTESTGDNGYGIWAMGVGSNSKGVHGYGTYRGVEGIGGNTGVYGETTGSTNAYGVKALANAGSGNFDFYAAGNAPDMGSGSSIRWKKNITPIYNVLEKVLKMRGVYFDWDEEHGGRHDIGMIAEEVGEVFPEIVGYEPDGKYTTGMDYSRLTSVLVEAIKEQQKQIEDLRKQIDELKRGE